MKDLYEYEDSLVQRKKLVLIHILSILQKHTDTEHTLTVAEIGQILERDYDLIVDRKAIKKNLLDLIAYGYEVGYTEKTRYTHGKTEKMLTDWYILRDFTDAELRLIVDSLLFSKHIPYNQCKELIGKIEKLSNKYFSNKVKHIRTMPENLPKNPELFLTIEILDEAIEKSMQVEFEYCEFGVDKKLHPRKNHKNEPKLYTVNPYQMVATNGRYYLIANFDYFENVGHYRIDRIKNIRIVEGSHRKPAEKVKELKNGLELPSHMAEHIYMFSGECGTVTFKAKKYIISDVIDWFGKDVRLFEESEDEITVSVKVNYQAMKYWALQYGVHITVTSPPSLVEEIRKDIVAVAEKYKV